MELPQWNLWIQHKTKEDKAENASTYSSRLSSKYRQKVDYNAIEKMRPRDNQNIEHGGSKHSDSVARLIDARGKLLQIKDDSFENGVLGAAPDILTDTIAELEAIKQDLEDYTASNETTFEESSIVAISEALSSLNQSIGENAPTVDTDALEATLQQVTNDLNSTTADIATIVDPGAISSGTTMTELELSSVAGNVENGSLTVLNDGSMVVTWADDANGVNIQKLDAQGEKIGSVITLANSADGYDANVAALNTGGFVVGYSVESGNSWHMAEAYAQQFDANMNTIGDAHLVRESGYGDQDNVSLVATDNGYAAVYESHVSNYLGIFRI